MDFFQFDIGSIALAIGVVITSIIAIHQWWTKRKLEALETLKTLSETERNTTDSQNMVARTSLEVVQLLLGVLNTMKVELSSEIKRMGTTLGQTIIDHAKDDERRFQEVMNQLQEIKKHDT